MNFAQQNDALFALSSAKLGEGVDELFNSIGAKLLEMEYWQDARFVSGCYE